MRKLVNNILWSHGGLRENLLRLRTFPQPVSYHRLGYLESAGNSIPFAVTGIRTAIEEKTLREQFVHRRVQRSAIIRRRGLVFDDFHATKQSLLPGICQRWSGWQSDAPIISDFLGERDRPGPIRRRPAGGIFRPRPIHRLGESMNVSLMIRV
jgi:hypothetical protein